MGLIRQSHCKISEYVATQSFLPILLVGEGNDE